MECISYEEIFEAAKLTYLDFLKGIASKEEDFRCVLYFHLRKMNEKNHSDIILLNPKKFEKYPDIVIIHSNNKLSYIELKQYIDFTDGRPKRKLKEDVKKLRMYCKRENNFYCGYIIHFYRNFQEWEELEKLGKHNKIHNIYFPDKNCEKIMNRFLCNKKNKIMLYKEAVSFIKSKKLFDEKTELKVKRILHDDIYKNKDSYGLSWIPSNTYIEKNEFIMGGYKTIIRSLVDITKNTKKPLRFYSDILTLSSQEIKKLKPKSATKDLIDLLIILKIYDLIRENTISIFFKTSTP